MSNKKSNYKYLSKDECLELLELKIKKINDKLYLMDFQETFKERVYSKSFTHINRGLNQLIDKKLLNLQSYDKRKLYNKVVNNLKNKKCRYCGNGFKPSHNIDKYCSKHCRSYAKREQDEKNKRKERKNPDYIEKQLGTSNLGAHANKDFDKEYQTVKNEFNNIFNNRNKFT